MHVIAGHPSRSRRRPRQRQRRVPLRHRKTSRGVERHLRSDCHPSRGVASLMNIRSARPTLCSYPKPIRLTVSQTTRNIRVGKGSPVDRGAAGRRTKRNHIPVGVSDSIPSQCHLPVAGSRLYVRRRRQLVGRPNRHSIDDQQRTRQRHQRHGTKPTAAAAPQISPSRRTAEPPTRPHAEPPQQPATTRTPGGGSQPLPNRGAPHLRRCCWHRVALGFLSNRPPSTLWHAVPPHPTR